VGAEFLQDLASWIFYPEKVVISVSDNGTDFREVAVFDSLSYPDPLMISETGKMIGPVNARFVRFYAKNTGKCPVWHIGHGGKAWLFADELIVDKR
jgi:hexosaminidase